MCFEGRYGLVVLSAETYIFLLFNQVNLTWTDKVNTRNRKTETGPGLDIAVFIVSLTSTPHPKSFDIG